MIDVATALSIVCQQTFDWGTETIPLTQATDRTLAEAITADRDQPPFDRVTMDGVAIDHASYRTGQRLYSVHHLAPAGSAPKALPDPTLCVEVMTGAPLPPGTTTVVRYEDVRSEKDGFVLPDDVVDSRNIHRRGSDAREGTPAIQAGQRLNATSIALLATYGMARVTVKKLPRVAIATTGDEVVPVENKPLDHQIRGSNLHQLAALFQGIRVQPTLAHLPDDDGAGRQKLGRLLTANDLLLLSGGVSKGKLDHVPRWLAGAGVDCLFHRIAQKPGKPLWVGKNETTMVFALPGNPVSSLLGAVAYVGPWLRRQLGQERELQRVVLADGVTFEPDLDLFRQVRIENQEGRLLAHPLPTGGSGDLVRMLGVDGFVHLPRGATQFPAGGVYDYLPLQLL